MAYSAARCSLSCMGTAMPNAYSVAPQPDRAAGCSAGGLVTAIKPHHFQRV